MIFLLTLTHKQWNAKRFAELHDGDWWKIIFYMRFSFKPYDIDVPFVYSGMLLAETVQKHWGYIFNRFYEDWSLFHLYYQTEETENINGDGAFSNKWGWYLFVNNTMWFHSYGWMWIAHGRRHVLLFIHGQFEKWVRWYFWEMPVLV